MTGQGPRQTRTLHEKYQAVLNSSIRLAHFRQTSIKNVLAPSTFWVKALYGMKKKKKVLKVLSSVKMKVKNVFTALHLSGKKQVKQVLGFPPLPLALSSILTKIHKQEVVQ